MIVGCTIAGLPVNLSDWQCDSVVNHGYRSLSGKIPESFSSAEQEAPVSLWLPNGDELWAGKLALDPITERGKRSISARGYAEDISADEDRMLYRSDGAAEWEDRGAEPFEYNVNAKYDLHQGRGSLQWKFGNNADSFATNDISGFALWKEGAAITRYTARITISQTLTGFDFLTQRDTFANIPNQTDIVSESLDFGGPLVLDVDESINEEDGEDLLLFNVIRTAGAGVPNGRRRVGVTRIRVYGRANWDDVTAFDVVDDVTFKLGWDRANIQTNPLEILPLDWTGDHADLLSYMAELTDWHWEAYGQAVHFGPWEETWTAHTATGVKPTWENQPRYNTVKVPFTYVSGAEGVGSATADPDPFPNAVVAFAADALEHPQPSSALAEQVAANMIDYYAAPRVAGRLELGRVYGRMGRKADGGEVRPGHLLQIADRPDLAPQRVVGMTYREQGYPVAEVTDDFNVVRLLDSIRPSKKKKKKKGRPGTGGPVR